METAPHVTAVSVETDATSSTHGSTRDPAVPQRHRPHWCSAGLALSRDGRCPPDAGLCDQFCHEPRLPDGCRMPRCECGRWIDGPGEPPPAGPEEPSPNVRQRRAETAEANVSRRASSGRPTRFTYSSFLECRRPTNRRGRCHVASPSTTGPKVASPHGRTMLAFDSGYVTCGSG